MRSKQASHKANTNGPLWVNPVGLTAYRRLPLYPPSTDIVSSARQVRFVPLPDIADGYIGSSSTPENSKWPE